jgi:solute carrier family 35, member E1
MTVVNLLQTVSFGRMVQFCLYSYFGYCCWFMAVTTTSTTTTTTIWTVTAKQSYQKSRFHKTHSIQSKSEKSNISLFRKEDYDTFQSTTKKLSFLSLLSKYDQNDNNYNKILLSRLSNIPRGGGSAATTIVATRGSRKQQQQQQLSSQQKVDVTTIPSSSTSSSLQQTMKVGFYFALWYVLNVYFNIINKQLLNVLPSSLIIGTIQLGVGAIYAILVWMVRLRPFPTTIISSFSSLRPYWYVGLCHSAGQLCSMVSLMAGPVSFTHIVKALEPFFSAAISILVTKSVMRWQVYITLLPVVGGVGYACLNERSFNWLAFYSAMASNVAFALRAVLSKVVMSRPSTTSSNGSGSSTKQSTNISSTNVFAIVTCLAFIVSIPIALVLEGNDFLSIWKKAVASYPITTTSTTNSSPSYQLCKAIIVSGLFHYWNNEVMYLALGNVHPITLAVGNTMKRVFIMIASVLVFRNPISIQAGIGSVIGISGVLVYSLTKQYYEKLDARMTVSSTAQTSNRKKQTMKKQ